MRAWALVALVGSGCRCAAGEGAPAAGDQVTIRVSVEPKGLTRLHDRQAEGTMVHYTVGPVYETLARADEADPEVLRPLLAESWVESEDHHELRVTLKPEVRFHDGSPLTAGDVKATVEVILDERNAAAAMRSTLGELTSFEVTGARTFVVKWRRAYFLGTRNFLLGVPVLPAPHLRGDFDTLALHQAPIGTGPFRFERWEHGVSLTLRRFEGYHGQRAMVGRVVLRFVPDEFVAAALWEQGAFDVMTRVPAATWQATEGAPWSRAYRRTTRLDNTYYWLGWNERRPQLAEVSVRRALALLYPAQLVSEVVDRGLEPRTTCPYYRSATACDPAITPLPFDPARAAALLDGAGWGARGDDGVRVRAGQRLAFTVLTTATSTKFGKLLPLYQEQLRAAGVELSIERVEAATCIARLRAHDFDAVTMSWSSADDVVDLYQLFHSSQRDQGSNAVGYANPEVDRRLETIAQTFDPAARAVLEREVHRLLYDDQVYLFLTLRPQLDAVKTRVTQAPWRRGWYELAGLQVR